jgi:ankyrin repeat protein
LLCTEHDVHALSRNRSTPLHYCAWMGRVDTVKILLEAGAETERHMHGGDTALHQAAWQGQLEVAKLLIEHKADIGAVRHPSLAFPCLDLCSYM